MGLRRNTSNRRLLSPKEILLTAGALIGIHALALWFAISQNYFYGDDFQFLTVAAQGGGDTDWIFSRHNVHFMPLSKLLSLQVGLSSTPFDWNLAMMQVLVLSVLTALAAFWALWTIFGPRPGILLGFGIHLTSPAIWVSYFWWTATLNFLLAQMFAYLLWGFSVRYLREKRIRDLFVIAVVFMLALSASSRSLLMTAMIGLIAWGYFADGTVLARLRGAIKNYWLLWLTLASIAAGYLYIFLTVDTENVPPANLEQTLRTMDIFLGSTTLSGLIAGPLEWSGSPASYSNPPFIVIVALAASFTLIIFWRWMNYRNVLIAPIVVLAHALLVALMIGWGRAGSFSFEFTGSTARYSSLTAGVFVIMATAVFLPIRGARSPLELRESPRLQITPRKWMKPVALVTVVSLSIASMVTFTVAWTGPVKTDVRDWTTTAVREIEYKQPQLASGIVPNEVLWGPFFPTTSRYSNFFAPIQESFQSVRSGNNLQTLDDSGRVVPAWVANEPTHLPGELPGCGFLVANQPTTIGFWPTDVFGSWITINYLSGAPGHMVVTASSGRLWRRVEVLQGTHTAFVWVDHQIESLTLTPSEGTGLCVDQVRSGNLTPRR